MCACAVVDGVERVVDGGRSKGAAPSVTRRRVASFAVNRAKVQSHKLMMMMMMMGMVVMGV